VKPASEGVSEARIDYGPGHRIYFATRGKVLIVLLVGGDKSNQGKDIKAAKAMWEAWKEENNDED
jgi:putative addiction module killer protein